MVVGLPSTILGGAARTGCYAIYNFRKATQQHVAPCFLCFGTPTFYVEHINTALTLLWPYLIHLALTLLWLYWIYTGHTRNCGLGLSKGLSLSPTGYQGLVE